jgi:hypothetical protein
MSEALTCSGRVDLWDRIPAKHPLRLIRRIVNEVLAALDGEFARSTPRAHGRRLHLSDCSAHSCCRGATRSAPGRS